MIDFKTLRESRTSQLDKLNAKVKSMSQSFQKDDERFWQPTADKAGNGDPTIRFLPHHKDEELPFIRYWDHGFRGPGGWYIELSRTSIGEPDPVNEHNSELWNSGGKAGRDIVSGTNDVPGSKRRLHYISNIYVVDDPEHPENNGKVFLFKYGPQIFEKLDEVMNPKLDSRGQLRKGSRQFNPFDLWEGANFVLKFGKEKGRRSYTSSYFEEQGQLFEDEKEMEKVWEQVHPLQQFVDPSLFKSYDELKRKLDRVLNTKISSRTVEQEDKVSAPPQKTRESFVKKTKEADDELPPWSVDEDDEDLSAFQELANR